MADFIIEYKKIVDNMTYMDAPQGYELHSVVIAWSSGVIITWKKLDDGT